MVDCSQISFISSIFSILSLSSWIWAQLPQIYTNYKNKSTEGISPSFLLLWFMGDFLNFSSCLLNDVVLNSQIYLSLFFLCNDIALCSQYYYYNSIYPRKKGKIPYSSVESSSNDDGDPMFSDSEALKSTEDFAQTNSVSVHTAGESVHMKPSFNSHIDQKSTAHASVQSVSSTVSPNGSYSSINDNHHLSIKSLAMGSIAHIASAQALPVALSGTDSSVPSSSFLQKDMIGILLSWGCTFVYVASRCPQLYKNYQRKSVEGISPILFGCALVGNLTYTLSILTSCDFVFDSAKSGFLLRELPYILGSSGTVLFDFAYFYQRHLYRNAGRNTTTMHLQNWDSIENPRSSDENSGLIY